MHDKYHELNLDGLAGPSHLFSGLAKGNLAATTNQGQKSRPKAAALQGLKKMRMLYKLGLKQAIIPPQLRPDWSLLRTHDEKLDKKDLLEKVYEEDFELFRAAFSSSSMWTANAATVSPSLDTQDGQLHMTVANLQTNRHRAIEAQVTYHYLKQIFPSFQVHAPLSASDEGAANHCRFAASYGEVGLELFVYGDPEACKKFPARQSKQACQEIIAKHGVKNYVLAEQSPEAIDAGVFHNDVISTSNENFFFYHEEAFRNQEQVISELSSKMDLQLLEVKNSEISLEEAVSSYIFNSQILTLPDQSMMILAPSECQENPTVDQYLQSMIACPSNPVTKLEYINLKQSMQNGGGPACLRLRVLVSEAELAQVNQAVMINDELLEKLEAWVNQYYRDDLEAKDLLDMEYLQELEQAQSQLLAMVCIN